MELILYILLGLAAVLLAVALVTRRAFDTEKDVWHLEAPGSNGTLDTAEDAEDDEEDEDAPLAEPVTVRALVIASCRTMDPLALTAASLVTFRNAEGAERTLLVPGEGGLHLLPEEEGLLTSSGDLFISFEKDNGEVIGAMYYIPAEDADSAE